MANDDIEIIRASFAKLFFDKERAGRLFYRRLFEIAPETRKLFATDIEVQARKLMETLAVAVSALRDVPALTATLTALGKRHGRYGVSPAHYPPVGAALIGTLNECLGPDFDAKTRAAWESLYGAVSAAMVAAYTPDAAAA